MFTFIITATETEVCAFRTTCTEMEKQKVAEMEKEKLRLEAHNASQRQEIQANTVKMADRAAELEDLKREEVKLEEQIALKKKRKSLVDQILEKQDAINTTDAKMHQLERALADKPLPEPSKLAHLDEQASALKAAIQDIHRENQHLKDGLHKEKQRSANHKKEMLAAAEEEKTLKAEASKQSEELKKIKDKIATEAAVALATTTKLKQEIDVQKHRFDVLSKQSRSQRNTLRAKAELLEIVNASVKKASISETFETLQATSETLKATLETLQAAVDLETASLSHVQKEFAQLTPVDPSALLGKPALHEEVYTILHFLINLGFFQWIQSIGVYNYFSMRKCTAGANPSLSRHSQDQAK
jgi:hypothetical protein